MALLTGFLRRQRTRVVRPYLGRRILDLGCGDSPLIRILVPNQSYTGVELNVDIVENLRRRYPYHRFISTDLDRGLPSLPGSTFDTIVMAAVIEHLNNPNTVLSQARNLLKEGGRLIITVPTSLGDRIHAIGSYVGLFSRMAAEDHVGVFSRKDLYQLLKQNKFETRHYRRFNLGLSHLIVAQTSPPESGTQNPPAE